jgi:subtilisin family serine protease
MGSRRVAVTAIGVSTLLLLGPAALRSAAAPGAPVDPPVTPTSAASGLAIDGMGALDEGTGPITVALQLPQEPAVLTWKKAAKAQKVSAGQAEQDRIETAQDSVVKAVSRLDSVSVLYRLTNAYNGVVVRVDRDQARALLNVPGVSAVRRMTPQTVDNASSGELIGSPAAWANGTGLTGQGVRIGIIDTGIDYSHQDFGGNGAFAPNDRTIIGDSPNFPSAKVAGGYDFAGDSYNAGNPSAVAVPDPDPSDCAASATVTGHGTHVAGTAAGYGENADGSTYTGPWNATTDLSAMHIGPGVAPQATLYALRVFGCTGSTNLVPQALDWAMDPDDNGNFTDHLDVVNMSLGSNYGSALDPNSVAVDNAVQAGVQVVMSAGNAGDLTYVSGSPGSAVRAVTAASSVDAGRQIDAFRFTPSGGTATTYAGSNSVSYNWTGKPDITAAVYVPTDRDGCTAFSGADLTNAAGHVLALEWNPDNLPSQPCGSVTRGNNAVAAGAVGVVIADQTDLISTGLTGVSQIPMAISQRYVGDAILAAVPVGTTGGSVTFSGSLVLNGSENYTPREDTVSTFSSRGPSLGTNALKPDLSAPGDTIFSAESGSGSEGQTLNGTSMAAPHVAGLMALLRQKHPTWTPEDLKALAMNTSGADLWSGLGHTGPMVSPVRQGTGRIQADKAVEDDVIAYSTDDPGAVSLSFGSLKILGTETAIRTFAVKNYGATSATYTLGVSRRTSVPGVSYDFPDGPTVTVAGGGTESVRLRLTADATAMDNSQDPNLVTTQGGLARHALSEDAGLVTLTSADHPSLRLAYLAVVRPASAMAASDAIAFASSSPGTAMLHLAGTGVNTGTRPRLDEKSLVTPLQLADTGARNAAIPASADLHAVGIATNRAALLAASPTTTAGNVVFGLETFAPHSTPGYEETEFDVFIDVDNNGSNDYALYNSRYSGTDVYTGVLYNLRTAGSIAANPLNQVSANTPTAIFNSEALVLSVPVSALHMVGSTLRWSVQTYSRQGEADLVGPFTFDVAHPGLDFSGPSAATLYSDLPGDTIPVAYDPTAFTAQGGKGALLLHHFNDTGAAAQLVSAAPAVVSSVEVAPSPVSLAKGTQQQLTATAVYSNGTTTDVTALATWSSDTASAPVGDSAADKGLVTGSSVGSGTITALFDSVSGTAPVEVTAATLTSIGVTPANPSIAKGTTQQYTATGTYSDSGTQDLTALVDWSTGDLGVASTDASGLLTGNGVGSTSVTATSGAVSGSAAVTVTAATLVSVDVTPADPSIPKGTQVALTATGVYTDGSTQDLTSTASWTSATPAVASVDGTGLVSGLTTGTSSISATSDGKTGSTTVTVTAAALSSIAVTPATPSWVVGTTKQLMATGTFSDGTTQDLTTTAVWTGGANASVSNASGTEGLANGLNVGNQLISAVQDGVTGSTTATITQAVLQSIAVTPADASTPKGTTKQYVATGTYSNGTTQVLTSTVTWASSLPSVASISNAAGSKGLATGLNAGTTDISAAQSGISGSTPLTVTVVTLRSVTVTPASPSMPRGTSRQMTATGTYSDGSTQNLTNAASWVASSSKVSVSNASSSKGFLKAVNVGSAIVQATVSGVQGRTTVTVTAAVLKALAVNPPNSHVAKGLTKQMSAVGTYTDGTTRNLTTSVTWSSTAAAATISNASTSKGLARGVAVGTTMIRATLGAIVGSTPLAVTAAELRSIAVTPGGQTLKVGASRQYTATGTYTDGTTRNITSTVVWSVTAGIRLTRSTPGLVTGVEPGPATVAATLNGLRGSATVNVIS